MFIVFFRLLWLSWALRLRVTSVCIYIFYFSIFLFLQFIHFDLLRLLLLKRVLIWLQKEYIKDLIIIHCMRRQRSEKKRYGVRRTAYGRVTAWTKVKVIKWRSGAELFLFSFLIDRQQGSGYTSASSFHLSTGWCYCTLFLSLSLCVWERDLNARRGAEKCKFWIDICLPPCEQNMSLEAISIFLFLCRRQCQ